MIHRVQLTNFKTFEKFRADLKGDAFLVGPNNAGKSTLLAALRAAAYMARLAARRKPPDVQTVDGLQRFGFRFSGSSTRLVLENLRHEFHPVETRLTVDFGNKVRVNAIWAVDPDDDSITDNGFFYVSQDGVGVRRPAEARDLLPTIGVVPVLSPLEHSERLLSDDYVSDSRDSRLSSRHLRNQVRLLKISPSEDPRFSTRWEEFREFAQPWLPGMTLGEVTVQYGSETSVDLYYHETGSRIPKEIFWAGDGVQIWLQLLLHLFRLRDRQVIVLDEPDVFMHADLQRRMVDLLESLPGQTITATHSAEVLAEAQDESVVWISKDRKRSVRSPAATVSYELATSLGTQFNLRLARALRARTVLFVEGQDAKLLRHLSRTLELPRLAEERDLVVIPMVGYDRWEHLEPFQWLISDFLQDSVNAYVILDRDYRPDAAIRRVERKLKQIGFGAHVWRRKELENYLLDPAAIARLSGSSVDWVVDCLLEGTTELEDDVWSQTQAQYERYAPRDIDKSTSIKEARRSVKERWAETDKRLAMCGGKDLLSFLNRKLQEDGKQAITDRRLARNLRAEEIPDELKKTLTAVEET